MAGAGRPASATGVPLQLRIGASTTIGNYLLPARVAALLADQPHVDVDLRIGNSAEVVAAVQRLEVDLGLIEGPCHESGLNVLPWQQDALVIVAAAASPLSARPDLSDLSAARWLLREPGSGTREAVEQALLPHLHHFARAMQLGSTEAIKQAAAAGLGVACLSRHAVADLVALGSLRILTPRCRRCRASCGWSTTPASTYRRRCAPCWGWPRTLLRPVERRRTPPHRTMVGCL